MFSLFIKVSKNFYISSQDFKLRFKRQEREFFSTFKSLNDDLSFYK